MAALLYKIRALVGVILFIYCTLYRALLSALTMGLGILRGIFHKR